VSRLKSVPSALMIHTSWWLSKAILPDSEDSEMDPPPVLGPEASRDGATGGAFGPPVHAPTVRTTAKKVVRIRPHRMPLSTPQLAGRFPTRLGSDRADETQRALDLPTRCAEMITRISPDRITETEHFVHAV